MKKFFKICIYITLSVLSVMGIRLLCCDRLKIIPIEGQLGFTDTYIPDASLCIPAAYTGFHDDIEGEYRINGKTYGSQSLKERVSIHPQKGLLISRNWLSAACIGKGWEGQKLQGQAQIPPSCPMQQQGGSKQAVHHPVQR